MISCSICPLNVRTTFALEAHQISHMREKTTNSGGLLTKLYACNLCPYATNNTNHLKRHKEAHPKDHLFACNSCPFKTNYEANLKRHQETIHSTKMKCSFSCNKCPFKTKHWANLKRHQMTKHTKTPKKFACNSCPYKSRFAYAVKRHHTLIHSKSAKMFSCDYCSFKSKFQASIKRHLKNIHPSESNTVEMLTSTNSSSDNIEDKSRLKIHTSSDKSNKTSAKKFACEFCQYIGARADRLEIHKQRTHADKIQLQFVKCDSCEYIGAREDLLQRHKQRCHSSNSLIKVKCDSCDYMGTRTDLLRKHKKRCRFKKISNFKCNYCEYIGTSLIQLTEHSKSVHLDETKMFPCPYCDYEGIREDLLRRHIRRIHRDPNNADRKNTRITNSERKFPCQSCGYVATRVSHLNRHCRNVHNFNNYPVKARAKNSIMPLPRSTQKKANTPRSPFTCKFCSYVAKHLCIVKRHELFVHTNLSIYHCESCSYKTNYHKNFKRHVLNKHGEEAYNKLLLMKPDIKVSEIVTSLVNQEKASDSKLRKSVSMVYNNTVIMLKKKSDDLEIFQCDSCSYNTHQYRNLKRHALKFHGEEVYKRLLLMKPSAKVSKIDTSVVKSKKTTDSKLQKSVSRVYSNTTRAAAMLKKYNASRNRYKKKFECTLCPFKSKYRSNLGRHNKMKHSTEIENCQAEENNVSCVVKQENSCDAVNESIEKMLECEFCSYKSQYPTNLKRHRIARHNMHYEKIEDELKNPSHAIKQEILDENTDKKPSPMIASIKTEIKDIACEIVKEAEDGQGNVCKFCGLKFKYQRNLSAHIKHKRCLKSKKRKKSKPSEKSVEKIPHDLSKLFACRSCSYITKYAGRLKIHEDKYHPNKLVRPKGCWEKYRCKWCPFNSKYNSNLKVHQEKFHPNKSNRDPEKATVTCLDVKKGSNSLGKKGRQLFSCQYCPFQSKYEYNLIKHITWKRCPAAKNGFEKKIEQPRNLYNKKSSKEPVEMFACELCPYNSKYQKIIFDHRKRCHGLKTQNSLEENTIESNGMKTENSQEESNHQEKNFACKLCPFISSYESSLRKHIKWKRCPGLKKQKSVGKNAIVPNGMKNKNSQNKINKNIFSCEFCEFKSSYSSSLWKHIKCKRCPGLKRKASYLKMNKKSTGVFSCKFCPFKSSYKASVMNHLRFKRCLGLKTLKSKNSSKSTSQPPTRTFSCRSCKFKFARKDALQRHKLLKRCPGKKSHKAKVKLSIEVKPEIPVMKTDKASLEMIRCKFCRFTSTNRSSFMRHRKQFHPTVYGLGVETELPVSVKEEDSEVTDQDTMQVYKCKFCSFDYKYKRCLERHEKQFHSEEHTNHFPVKNEISFETVVQGSLEVFQCVFCPFTSQNKIRLEKHQNKYHKNNLENSQPGRTGEANSFDEIGKNEIIVKQEIPEIRIKLENLSTEKQNFSEELSKPNSLENKIKTEDSVPFPDSGDEPDEGIQKTETKMLTTTEEKELSQKGIPSKSTLKCTAETLVRQEIKEKIDAFTISKDFSSNLEKIAVTTDSKEKAIGGNQCKFCLVKCANPDALIMHLKRHICPWRKKTI